VAHDGHDRIRLDPARWIRTQSSSRAFYNMDDTVRRSRDRGSTRALRPTGATSRAGCAL